MKRIVISSILIFALLLCSSCNEPFEPFVDNEQLQSYSVEELVEVFNQYHEEFNQVAEIVLRNEAMEQFMFNAQEDVMSIWSEEMSIYFSEEEWSVIKELFRLTGMNRIERNVRSGKDVIKFLYRNSNYTTKLFFCETNDENDLWYHKQKTTVFRKIEDNWWIGYSPDHIISGRTP